MIIRLTFSVLGSSYGNCWQERYYFVLGDSSILALLIWYPLINNFIFGLPASIRLPDSFTSSGWSGPKGKSIYFFCNYHIDILVWLSNQKLSQQTFCHTEGTNIAYSFRVSGQLFQKSHIQSLRICLRDAGRKIQLWDLIFLK